MGSRLDTEAYPFDLANTSVGTSFEQIGNDVQLGGLYDDITATVENLGGVDLTGLRIDIALTKTDHTAGDWHVLIEDSADWTSSVISMKEWIGLPGAQTDISLLAATTKGGLWLHFPKPIHAFRVFAKVGSGTTSLTFNGEAKRRA